MISFHMLGKHLKDKYSYLIIFFFSPNKQLKTIIFIFSSYQSLKFSQQAVLAAITSAGSHFF